jgi:predicted aminopeptidase
LNGAAARLGELYRSGLPHAEILRRRDAIFTSIKADYAQLKPHLSGLERFDLDKEPLNNAVLINYLIYFHDLDTFAELDHVYGGNLHDTIKAIIALAESDPANPFAPIERAVRVSPQRAISGAADPQSTLAADPAPSPARAAR